MDCDEIDKAKTWVNTVCEKDMCCGCKLCIDNCPTGAIKIVDNLKSLNALIDRERCISCGLCRKLCPQNHSPKKNEPIYWGQGWATDELRDNSSSGGFAIALAKRIIQDGGVFYSCKFEDGDFKYASVQSVFELNKFSGSKYVKSNPTGVYYAIKKDLEQKKQVLFVGLPCHSGALRNYIPLRLQDNLYVVDLICHGSPSVKLLEIALAEYGYKLSSLQEIFFRDNVGLDIENGIKTIVTRGIMDRYTIGFLRGIFFTYNCYFCQYAGIARVGDITIGDSWGTKLDKEEIGRGISLALCQTEKGYELLKKSDVKLHDVDLKSAISGNEQLKHPYIYPSSREIFFGSLSGGSSFKNAVFKALPQQCVKQCVKEFFIKMKIWDLYANKCCTSGAVRNNPYQIAVKV